MMTQILSFLADSSRLPGDHDLGRQRVLSTGMYSVIYFIDWHVFCILYSGMYSVKCIDWHVFWQSIVDWYYLDHVDL